MCGLNLLHRLVLVSVIMARRILEGICIRNNVGSILYPDSTNYHGTDSWRAFRRNSHFDDSTGCGRQNLNLTCSTVSTNPCFRRISFVDGWFSVVWVVSSTLSDAPPVVSTEKLCIAGGDGERSSSHVEHHSFESPTVSFLSIMFLKDDIFFAKDKMTVLEIMRMWFVGKVDCGCHAAMMKQRSAVMFRESCCILQHLAACVSDVNLMMPFSTMSQRCKSRDVSQGKNLLTSSSTESISDYNWKWGLWTTPRGTAKINIQPRHSEEGNLQTAAGFAQANINPGKNVQSKQ